MSRFLRAWEGTPRLGRGTPSPISGVLRPVEGPQGLRGFPCVLEGGPQSLEDLPPRLLPPVAIIYKFSVRRHCPELMPLEKNEHGCQGKGGCPGERLPGVARRMERWVERRMARRMARTRRTKGRVEENAPTW